MGKLSTCTGIEKKTNKQNKKTTEEEVKLLKFDVLTFKLDFSAIYSNIFKHFT